MTGARLFVATLVAAALCACAGSDRPDNAGALADIDAHRSGVEVVVSGIVTHVGRTSAGDTGRHKHFDVRIASGAAEQDILVADNITVGTAAPVHPGDAVIVKGVLEVDESGSVIHWTHHDPAFRHEAGYVIVNGKKYD